METQLMKKIVPALAFLLLTAQCFSQIAGNAVYNYNTIFQSGGQGEVDLNLNHNQYSFSNILEANVMINVKASSYVAIFSLSQNGNTVEEAERMMQNRVDVFKNQLVQANAGGNTIFIDPVSLVPTYEIEVTEKKFSRNFTEVPSGFEIKKNVHITFMNHADINAIITVAAKAEVYDLVKVDYVVDDISAVLAQLRKEALGLLAAKKESLGEAGLHARFTQIGEKYGSVFPMERYTQYYAYKTGVTPAYTASYKKGATHQVQYNYADKNKTIYYEKVSEKQFDKVINPVVGEPVVQVYLSLKAQYQLFDPETEATEKAYNMQVRQLQLKEMELRIEEKKKDIELKGKLKEPADKAKTGRKGA
jgi:uncharacterized protein YggE